MKLLGARPKLWSAGQSPTPPSLPGVAVGAGRRLPTITYRDANPAQNTHYYYKAIVSDYRKG